MAAIGIQPGSISPTIVYPEISNPIKKPSPTSEVQGPPQQNPEPDPHSEQSTRQKDLEVFLRSVEQNVKGYDPNTSELSVGVDKDTHRIVVKVLNSKTREVIRQIPPEEILRIARNLKKMGVGFLDETA
jgi:flagellar protein FlaG